MKDTGKMDDLPSCKWKEFGNSNRKEEFHSTLSEKNKELKNDIQWSKKTTFKNLNVVSVTFLLLFIAYDGVAILQSTMNSAKGVGVASQATIYAFFCTFALFLPKYVIRKLGCKQTLTLSMLAYCPYIASNFYPHWATLIPSAVLLGCSAAMLWAAKCTYLNELSLLQSLHGEEDIESITAKFFGLSGVYFMSSHVWCNLMSYYILQKDYVDIHLMQGNGTQISCGSNFSAQQELINPYLQEPSKERRYFLSAAFLACGLVSVLLNGLMLDTLPRDKGQLKEEATLSIDMFMSTINLMRKTHQILLMPLVAFSGVFEAFYFSDFTKAYIACPWGIHYVGYVTIAYGITCSVSSYVPGLLIEHTGRIPVFLIIGAINVAFVILLFTWMPNSSETTMFFVMAGMSGFVVGATSSHVRVIYGILFPDEEEAAFSNYYLWHSLGSCASYSYSDYLHTTTKIYLLCILFALAVIGYFVLEIKLILSKRSYKINGT